MANNGTVIRVERDRDFTVMKNYHLKDTKLSLKAIGLLCKVFSLPENWNYSINGLVSICKEGRDTIRTILQELQECGYLEINKLKNDKGQFIYEYVFKEKSTKNPDVENPVLDIPDIDLTREYNTYKYNTKQLSTNNTISPNGQEVEEEIISNDIVTNKPTGQLIPTSSKPKKKGENQFITVIQNLSSNTKVQDALLEYCNFRRSKGLTVQQWKIIVEDFKNSSVNKNSEQVIRAIRDCLKFGNMSLFYRENNYTQNSNSNVPTSPSNESSIDLNTFMCLSEENQQKFLHMLTPEQKELYEIKKNKNTL